MSAATASAARACWAASRSVCRASRWSARPASTFASPESSALRTTSSPSSRRRSGTSTAASRRSAATASSWFPMPGTRGRRESSSTAARKRSSARIPTSCRWRTSVLRSTARRRCYSVARTRWARRRRSRRCTRRRLRLFRAARDVHDELVVLAADVAQSNLAGRAATFVRDLGVVLFLLLEEGLVPAAFERLLVRVVGVVETARIRAVDDLRRPGGRFLPVRHTVRLREVRRKLRSFDLARHLADRCRRLGGRLLRLLLVALPAAAGESEREQADQGQEREPRRHRQGS